jgi:hypothetical protein
MRGLLYEIIPGPAFDQEKFVSDFASKRPVDLSACELREHPNVIESFKDDFIQHLLKHGFTATISRKTLTEALVAPGSTPHYLVQLMHSFLNALAVTDDLIIVDPYFFAAGGKTSNSNYPSLVVQILQPVLSTLKNLSIVTLPNTSVGPVVANVNAAILAAAPHVNVLHKTSNSFHDRFWLEPKNGKAFLTGTSLNGLGRKYALVDHLQQADAADLLNALRAESLA